MLPSVNISIVVKKFIGQTSDILRFKKFGGGVFFKKNAAAAVRR